MSYWVETETVDFFVEHTVAQPALNAINRVTQFHGGTTDVTTVADALEAAGFTVEENPDGTAIINYHNNTRHEGRYLAALAAYVRDGSYVEWLGATPGDRWRYVVRDGQLISRHPHVTWIDDLHQPAELAVTADANDVVGPPQ